MFVRVEVALVVSGRRSAYGLPSLSLPPKGPFGDGRRKVYDPLEECAVDSMQPDS